MKKIFGLIVVLTLSLSVFTACTHKAQQTNLPLGFYQSSKADEFGEFRYIGITLTEDNKCEVSFSMSGDFFTVHIL